MPSVPVPKNVGCVIKGLTACLGFVTIAEAWLDRENWNDGNAAAAAAADAAEEEWANTSLTCFCECRQRVVLLTPSGLMAQFLSWQ